MEIRKIKKDKRLKNKGGHPEINIFLILIEHTYFDRIFIYVSSCLVYIDAPENMGTKNVF